MIFLLFAQENDKIINVVLGYSISTINEGHETRLALRGIDFTCILKHDRQIIGINTRMKKIDKINTRKTILHFNSQELKM